MTWELTLIEQVIELAMKVYLIGFGVGVVTTFFRQ